METILAVALEPPAAHAPGFEIGFKVADVDAALAQAISRGAEPIDRVPRSGARGSRVAFLHPRSTSGALVEFVQSARASAGTDSR